jgi:hypothetical protein
MHENWWGWLAAFIIFAAVQAWRALFRATNKAQRNDGMARLNAAAQRILKERGATAAHPIPRHPGGAAKAKPSRIAGGAIPRSAPLPKSSTPAVIRRNGIFGGQEPVITRRR